MKIKNRSYLGYIILLILGGSMTSALFATSNIEDQRFSDTILSDTIVLDSICTNGELSLQINKVDSVGDNEKDRYTHLTESDFQLVADELGVEIATLKAVVEIETGKVMKGFWAPGIPVINFDRTMYLKYRSKAESKSGASGEKIPEGLTGYALKEWKQLIEARKTNAQGANLGTFWGMFQIGGFNYKLCGCKTVDEFVKRIAYSELEQLQLFAVFITNSGMVESLRNKDWKTFARKYNGPSYAKRGYHTKMAKAYLKFSK